MEVLSDSPRALSLRSCRYLLKTVTDAFDLKRDCPELACVVSAIIKYSKVLRDKKASQTEKVEALKFVVHFVGDVHQPMP